jgi:uncharacterized membrane protein (DUF2068 family)
MTSVEHGGESGPMKAIIAYKAIKGVTFLLLGVALMIALLRGEGDHLHALAVSFHERVTAWFAIELSDAFLKIATPGHLALTTAAIGLDGVVTLIEAWLLHRGQRWAIWLVVGASSSLIPWELYALAHQFHWMRLLLLLLNVAVVIYLGLQASKHLAAHRRAMLSI